MDDKLNSITNNIKSYRVRSGLSQEETAKILNIARETYCSYEVNPARVKIETYMKLANIFGCELKDFFLENKVTQSDN